MRSVKGGRAAEPGYAKVVGPGLVMMLALVAALSAPPVSGEGFSIRSDETIVEDGGNRKILRGNVVIEYEDIRFEAQEVVQHFSNGTPVRYEATGDPVLVRQKGNALKGLQQGTCEKLTYLVEEETLELVNYELHLEGGIVQRGGKLRLVF